MRGFVRCNRRAKEPIQILARFGVLFGATCTLCAQCHFAKTNATQAITYRFGPEVTPGGLVLHVKLEFQSGVDGTQMLVLPVQWAGETIHAMTNLHAVSKGALLDDGPDLYTKICTPQPIIPL